MDLLVTSIRRTLWLVLLSAVGGAAYAFWRDRRQADELAPAEWPPLDTPAPPVSSVAATTAPARTTPSPTTPSPTTPAPTTPAPTTPAATSTPEPDAASGDGWVAPLDDGSCPIGHPIKANDKSGIFHVPEGRFYERTKAERCYASAEAATADGYRRSKS